MPNPANHVLIGNPENRRVELFQAALRKFRLPPATVLPYADLLDDISSLEKRLTPQSILRIESPGENEEVTRKLIAFGADSCTAPAETTGVQDALQLQPDHGRIRFQRAWYLGFRRLLSLIAQRTESNAFHNHPNDIALMFEKPACHKRLSEMDIRVPPDIECVESLDHLLDEMTQRDWSRVFIKPAHGSSASGVIAFFYDGTNMRAVTSIEIEHSGSATRLYNNLRMQTYTNRAQIAAMIDYLCNERVHVERWLPKASLGDKTFDLRILVVGGIARHVVVRTSRTPITNLHLGNQRGDTTQLRQDMGGDTWQSVMVLAERASRAVAASLYVGVDLLLEPGYRNPTVLELNAFGDLLPRVIHDGDTTHEAQVRAIIR